MYSLMFVYDLKNAIFNRKMILAIALVLACLFVGGAEVLFSNSEGIDFSYLFLFSLSCGTSSVLALIYPVLACIPYSDTYSIEKSSGYLLYKSVKKEKSRYILSKWLSCGVSGGLVISVPVAIYFVICLLSKGTDLVNNGMQYITHNISFYQNAPVLYCFGYVGNAFVCGMIFSIMGLAISVFIKNRYLIIFLPLVIYIVLNILFSDMMINLNPILWWDINLINESNSVLVTGVKISVLIIASIIFAIGVICDDKK